MEFIKPINIPSSSTESVFESLRTYRTNTFFPVTNGNKNSLGIVREKDLKHFIYSRFGRDLSLNQSLEDFVSKCPVSEIHQSVENILEVFSTDEESEGIIITQSGTYAGFLSAKSLLKVLNEKNLAIARGQNPLTTLPGNNLVYEFISKALLAQEVKFPLLAISAAILHLTKTRTGLSRENMSALIAKLKREAKQLVDKVAMKKCNYPRFFLRF